ncbi:MAG: hypothetical protein GY778_22275 [bacterium]|nr:hypothetical protein [bacterium]
MIGFLKRLFTKQPALIALASGEDAASFVNALGSVEITLLGALHGNGLDRESSAEENLLAEIERATADLVARKTFSPFCYEDEGVTLLPFFTSHESTELFCGAFCGREDRLFQFPAFVLNVSVLAHCVDECDSVVMDPQSDNEFVLTTDHLNALKSARTLLARQSALSLLGLPRSARSLITPMWP